jgi:hypothetical protein
MRRRHVLPLVLFVEMGVAVWAENWPQWRDPSLNGVSGEDNLPVK